MKPLWRIVILVVLVPVAAHPTPRTKPMGTTQAPESAWPELQASMHKMHAEMAAVNQSGNSDVDFLRLMRPHHQAAIDMAKAELLYGKDPQLRRLAQEIITDQQSEIELMQLWLKQHEPDTHK